MPMSLRNLGHLTLLCLAFGMAASTLIMPPREAAKAEAERTCRLTLAEAQRQSHEAFVRVDADALGRLLAAVKAEGFSPAPSEAAFAAIAQDIAFILFVREGCVVARAAMDLSDFTAIVAGDPS